MPNFQEHPVEWTDEKIARFWDYQSRSPHAEERYFARMAGDGVVRLAGRRVKLAGHLLDFGAGKGHLAEFLLRQAPARVYAVEYSELSCRAVNERVRHPRFQGCQLLVNGRAPFPDSFFDGLFLVETIEHLTDRHLPAVLAETARLVKSGGFVVITTPHRESLAAQELLCPDCGCRFHPVQHVRSFAGEDLTRLLSGYGFTRHFCRAVNLENYRSRDLMRRMRWWMLRLLAYLPPRHLVYIGRKT
jgi:SAM-dependent methyltransferase